MPDSLSKGDIKMKRINIVGPSGSGKSTLAKELHKINGLPVFHMDQLFFRPGWMEKPKAELASEVDQILQTHEEWIIEGNYSRTLPSRLKDCSMIIFLDYPRYLYVYRVLKRLLKTYSQVREDMAAGCPERVDWVFLKYVWQFKSRRRDRLMQAVETYLPKDCELIVIQNKRACTRFVNELKTAAE